MKRVYQGGHHDVWCDGEKHRKTAGGYCWPEKPFDELAQTAGPEFKCDCRKWAVFNDTLNKPNG